MHWKRNTRDRLSNKVVHHLKSGASEFEMMQNYHKKATLRSRSDRMFSVGDILRFYKLNSQGIVEEYSPTLYMRVTHVQSNYMPSPDLVLLSLDPVEDDEVQEYTT